jgi:hypothetical protein
MRTRFTQLFFMVALFLCLNAVSFATVYTSTTSGNWSTMTWSPAGSPGATDDVIIANGTIVTIDTSFTVANLTVGQGISGTLTFNQVNWHAVTVTGNVAIAAGGTFQVPTPSTNVVTGDISLSSPTILNVSNVGVISTGMGIVGTGIPTGATVTSVTPPSTITISLIATATIVGDSLTVGAVLSHTLAIGGNLTNNGTFDMAQTSSLQNCTVTFNSSSASDQNITGTTPILTRFRNVSISRGAQANKVVCNINVTGAGGFFTTTYTGTWEQTAGTFSVTSGNVNIGLLTPTPNNACTFNIIGTASAKILTSLNIFGTFLVNTSGTIEVGSGIDKLDLTAKFTAPTHVTATFTAGLIKVYGKLVTVGDNDVKFQGADFIVDPKAFATNDYAFRHTGGALAYPFYFTAGSITILNPNPFAAANPELAIAGSGAGTANISGSALFVLGNGGSTIPGLSTGFKINLSASTLLNHLTINTGSVGVTLATNVKIKGTLTLTSGIVTSATATLLTLNATSSLSGGNASSYVKGPLTWTVATTAQKVLEFPIGKGTAYRPLTLTVTQNYDTSTTYTAEQFEAAPPALSLPGSLTGVSSVRYFNINKSGTSVAKSTLKMSYSTDDGITDPTKCRVARGGTTAWIDLGGQGTAPTTGTLTSTADYTGFGNFVIGSGSTLYFTGMIEGFNNGGVMTPDTVTVELRSSGSPYALVESQKTLLNSTGYSAIPYTSVLASTPYWIVVKHRNSVETWSAATNSFAAGSITYDFTSAQAQAYGSNMVLKDGEYCFYSGDANQDGIVDSGDLGTVDNDNANYISGYTVTDVNGDGIVDSGDLGIVDNNNSAYVGKIIPPGAPRQHK